MWLNVLAAAILIPLSALLMLHNHHSWRGAGRRHVWPDEYAYFRSRYYRRTQANVLIGILGIALFLGHWVTLTKFLLWYWLAALGLVVWLLALALADMASTRRYCDRLRSSHVAERHVLEQELLRWRKENAGGNERLDGE